RRAAGRRRGGPDQPGDGPEEAGRGALTVGLFAGLLLPAPAGRLEMPYQSFRLANARAGAVADRGTVAVAIVGGRKAVEAPGQTVKLGPLSVVTPEELLGMPAAQ